jgi:hypothetical protein
MPQATLVIRNLKGVISYLASALRLLALHIAPINPVVYGGPTGWLNHQRDPILAHWKADAADLPTAPPFAFTYTTIGRLTIHFPNPIGDNEMSVS